MVNADVALPKGCASIESFAQLKQGLGDLSFWDDRLQAAFLRYAYERFLISPSEELLRELYAMVEGAKIHEAVTILSESASPEVLAKVKALGSWKYKVVKVGKRKNKRQARKK